MIVIKLFMHLHGKGFIYFYLCVHNIYLCHLSCAILQYFYEQQFRKYLKLCHILKTLIIHVVIDVVVIVYLVARFYRFSETYVVF